MTATILPPNRTTVEEGLERGAARLDEIAVEIPRLWDPATCPADDLRLLAWAFSVDDWSEEWPEAVRREVIAEAMAVHRIKGTKAGIKAGLAAMGYGNVQITEAWELPRLGVPEAIQALPLGRGWALGSGDVVLGVGYLRTTVKPLGFDWVLGWSDVQWPDYWVQVNKLISRAEMDRIAGRLAKLAPARCRLRQVSSFGVRIELGTGGWALGYDVTLGAGTNDIAPIVPYYPLGAIYLTDENGAVLTDESGAAILEG